MFQNKFKFHPLFCTHIPQRLSISFCSCFSCSSVELYSLEMHKKYSVVLYLVSSILPTTWPCPWSRRRTSRAWSSSPPPCSIVAGCRTWRWWSRPRWRRAAVEEVILVKMSLTGHLDREDHVDLSYESSPDRLVPKLHVRVVQSHLIPSLPLLHRELPLHIGVLSPN